MLWRVCLHLTACRLTLYCAEIMGNRKLISPKSYPIPLANEWHACLDVKSYPLLCTRTLRHKSSLSGVFYFLSLHILNSTALSCLGRHVLPVAMEENICSSLLTHGSAAPLASHQNTKKMIFRNHKITKNWPHTTISNISIQTTVKSPIHHICFNNVFIYSVLLSFARLGTEPG